MNAITTQTRTLTSSLEKVGENVGNTPMIHIAPLSSDTVQVYAKCEWSQISGSVKARAAYNIVRSAVDRGALHPGKRLLDASSGNTAIAYGHIARAAGLEVTICLPRNASQRRIEMLNDLGVEIVFTSPFEGTEGAQEKARELFRENPDLYFYADQYSNEANWKAHYDGTALEIFEQTDGRLTHFVAGLGTTGTFVGTTRRLKELGDITCIGLQPDSPMHIMEGWKHLETADVPSIYDQTVADDILDIASEDVIDMMKLIDGHLGLRISPSASANLVGAGKVARSIDRGIIVTTMADAIDRYSEIEKEVFG